MCHHHHNIPLAQIVKRNSYEKKKKYRTLIVFSIQVFIEHSHEKVIIVEVCSYGVY